MVPADDPAGTAPSPDADAATQTDADAARDRGVSKPLPVSLYRFVWRESRRRQVGLCLLTATVFPLSLAPLELQRRIVDGAIRDPNVELLVTLCLIYLGAAVLHSLTKFARNMAVGAIAERTARDLRLHILERMGRIAHRSAPVSKPAPKAGHEGSSVSLIASEAEKVGAFAGDAVSQPLMQAGIMLSVLGYMLYIDWRTAAASLAVYVPAAALAPAVQRCINRHVERKTALMRRLGDVTAGTGGMDEAGAEDATPPRGQRADHADRPEILTLDVMKARLCVFLYKFGFKAFNNLMGELGRLAVLFVGGWFVIQGETEVGVLVAFLSGLEKVADPARELLNFYRQLSQSRVQYDILRRAVDERPTAG